MRFFMLLAPVLLCAQLGAAAARPGGGQMYRAPVRSAPTYHAPPMSPHAPPVYHSPSYHPVPVPVPGWGSRAPYPNSPGSPYVRSPAQRGSPLLTVFLVLLVVAVGLLVLWLVLRARRARGIEAGPGTDRGARLSGVLELQKRDPGFDPAAFAERVRATVIKVNEAWCQGSMGPVRRLLSDGVYVRFRTQLALLRQSALRNRMADWKVLGAELLAAEADELWDAVHVRVSGEARDVDVPLAWEREEEERKARSAPLRRYEEVWTFLRRRGAPGRAEVLAGRCPKCGEPLPGGEVVRCGACLALVNSGEHDWVLAKITQPGEWRPGAVRAAVPGLLELRQRDPAASRTAIEDRAALIFWKWIEARVTGSRERLARFCVEPPAETDAAELCLQPAPLRQVAVGAAELGAVEPGTRPSAAGDSMDHALVEIRWSACPKDRGGEPQGQVHVFVLARACAARSGGGLSSLDCPKCGTALDESDVAACAACGEPLGGGRHEWALLSVASGELPPSPQDYE